MTRNESGQFGRLRKRAAIIVAVFFCATTSVAQNVTLRSEGGGLEVSGRYIGYDGENIQIESEFGPLTLRYDTVACEGEICPDATAYFPKLKLSGSRRMADLLMPAQGWVVATQQSDTTHFTHTMTAGDDPKPVARFSFRATSTDEGFPT
jgi:phosphate transport system substrate-binding protein